MIDQLIAEVRNIASARPEVTYDHEDCRYDSKEASDGSVGCIFGQALTAIGWDITGKNDGRGIIELLRCKDYEFNDDRILWCNMVQGEQDNGRTWGDSVAEADNLLDITES